MKKFAIPAILVATVMVAGMFAFMPVEQASTVHDTVIDSVATTSQGFRINGIDLIQDNGAIEPGEFILLSDTTDVGTDGHIALANVPCDSDSDPAYTIITGEAPVFTTLITAADVVVALSAVGEGNNDFDGLCTYHDDYVDETDIALTKIVIDGVSEAADDPLDQTASVTIYSNPS